MKKTRIDIAKHFVNFHFGGGNVVKVPVVLFGKHSSVTISGPHSVIERAYVATYVILIDNVTRQPVEAVPLDTIDFEDIKSAGEKAGLKLIGDVKQEGILLLWKKLIAGSPLSATIKSFGLKSLKFVGSLPIALATGVLGDAKKTGMGADMSSHIRSFSYKLPSAETVFVSVYG